MANDLGIRRLRRELAHIQADGISPTVHVAPHSRDMTTIDALVVGPPDTPYDGAMLRFRLKVPPDYPMKPPQVKFLSTDGGTLRIHPQLYADGKVCLSILGTWHGPKWSAGLSLRTLLLSIQSLLNEEPLRCEPGLENAPQEAVDRASAFVAHEATRVLVLAELSSPSWGPGEDFESFTAAMRAHLAARRAALLERLAALARTYDGQFLRDPFALTQPSAGRRYDFASLARQLSKLLPAQEGEEVDDSQAAAVEEEGEQKQRQQEGAEDQSSGAGSDTEDGHAAPYCRICHQTEAESESPLIAPCRCSGSIGHAHSQCLLDWLHHSAAAASSSGGWRCDICRAKFRVRLGGGRAPGRTYLARDLDVLGDRDFDAPGLVAILLVSLLQVLSTCLGRVAAQTVLGLVSIVCRPLPAAIGDPLLCILSVPAVLLDVLTNVVYILLFGGKAAVALSGPGWRPAAWGTFGEERVGVVLNALADNLGFAVGIRLDGLAVLCAYFWSSHLVGLVCSHSWVVLVARGCLGVRNAEGLLASLPGFGDVFTALSASLPEAPLALWRVVHGSVAVASLALNFVALARLLKRAFLDAKPVPIAVLPCAAAPPPRPPKATRRVKAAA